MTHPTTSERGEVIEAATIAGYEARARKTGSPKWGYRDPDSQRRYREIVTAAFEALEAMGVIDLSPQTQTPPPDAIRAAIAELCRRAIVYGQDTTIATLKELQAAERGVDNALTQLGAIPAAGRVTISIEVLENLIACVDQGWGHWPLVAQAIKEAKAVLANGADDGE